MDHFRGRLLRSSHPENDFAIDALRASLDPEVHLERLSDGASFDWSAVIAGAAEHRVTGVVFSACNDRGPANPARGELTERMMRITARNLAVTSALRSTLVMLERAGVKATAAPGPAVALLSTGSPWYELVDAELLIDSTDVSTATHALGAAGYRQTMSRSGATSFVLNAHEDRRVVIRSRIEPAPARSRFPVGDALARAVDCAAPGGTLRVLASEDLLVALSARGAAEGWPTLDYVFAVAAVERHVADWERVRAVARIAGRERSLNVGAWLGHHLLAVDLPGPDAQGDGLARQTSVKIARRLREPMVPTPRVRSTSRPAGTPWAWGRLARSSFGSCSHRAIWSC